MAKISPVVRRELVRLMRERYGEVTGAEREQILDELVRLSGYHRKYAIGLLNGTEKPAAPDKAIKRGRPTIYGEAVRQALIVLWEASDRVCGKRLKALFPVLIPALEKHGHLNLDARLRAGLLSASASSIDRLLTKTRSTTPKRRKPMNTVLRKSVPVRTFADWNDPLPGSLEADLVAHCGETIGGTYVHTLTLTDIASGWTECVPLAAREATLVKCAIDEVRAQLPFPLRALDTNNGLEFLNDTLLDYCEEHDIHFTRSRPYRKNDQAWVEQKNSAVVRRLVGYRRLEGLAAAAALSRLYAVSRFFVNFFQPSFTLIQKTRNGARVSKRYDAPKTPCQRLLASEAVTEEIKFKLQETAAQLDPLRLLEQVRKMQSHLVALVDRGEAYTPAATDNDLTGFLSSLSTLWRSGEARPTHHSKPKPARHWRTRPDPFAAVWPQVLGWLEVNPDLTAKELFLQLRRQHPGTFDNGQLRTLHRRVKEWRVQAARRLVFGVQKAQ